MNENGREVTNASRRRRGGKRRGRRRDEEREHEYAGGREEPDANARRGRKRKGADARPGRGREERRRALPGRPHLKWTPPALPTEPIPTPVCPLCGEVITDLASALTDNLSGEAAHFDCVRNKIAEVETLRAGQIVSYIGAGRFGIIHYQDLDKRFFKIDKIIEYEGVDKRAEWRNTIADHFSMT